MAPSNTSMVQAAASELSSQGLRKLRKPAIEKMRRDRINSSIEQLRILLEKEFQKHHLPSKPEKADILEMTVTFLQQHLAGRSAPSSSQSYREGYSRCIQESERFLSLHKQTEVQRKLLQNIHGSQAVTVVNSPCGSALYPTTYKQTHPETTNAIWRPW